jgi:hypothetical protein
MHGFGSHTFSMINAANECASFQLSEGRRACALRLSCALCVHREVKTGTNVCNIG